MGKGDIKTRRGKIFNKSFGKYRPRKSLKKRRRAIQKKNYPICYLCGKRMVREEYYLSHKDLFKEKPCFLHEEHIIQNALYGRLKSDSILCKKCGNILGDDIDSQFVALFAPFIGQLKKKLITKDHGEKNAVTLKGHLYKDEKFENKIDVQIREGKVSPVEPFHKIDKAEKIVKICANEKRAKQYEPIVRKKMKEEGLNPSSFDFETITDIHNEGILAYLFTEGVVNFNDKFKKGFVKIAVDFAAHCGIKRKDMPQVLEINNTMQIGKLKYDNCCLPFVCIGTLDTILEINRPQIEKLYPTHTLILFNQKIGERNFLYCYIDLFSTFQYYVLLNTDYKGKSVHKVFYQTILKQEIPEINVRDFRPKELAIIINQYGIDMSKCKSNNLTEMYDFIEKEIHKYKTSPILNFPTALKNIFDRVSLSIALQVGGKEIPGKEEVGAEINYQISDSEKKAIIYEMYNYNKNEEHFNYQLYRNIFYENDGKGGVEPMSSPIECNSSTITDKVRKAYCHMKFEQLNRFISQKYIE